VSKPIRIAICGKPGSGKTTIAKALVERLEGGIHMSFANGVRVEAAWALAGAVSVGAADRVAYAAERYLEAMMDPATKDQYRHLLQVWGTEFRRKENDNYWVHVLEAALEFYPERPVVIDDCRFPNEYSLLKSYGFTFVVLDDGETTREQGETEAAHESEQHWPHFSFDFNLPYVKGPETQAQAILDILDAIEELG
jgi:hypothetical protein